MLFADGWKLRKVEETLRAAEHLFDVVIMVDAFDVLFFSGLQEIVDRFRRFQSPMVISGERECWPHAELAPAVQTAACPNEPCGPYPYPNGGGYIAEVKYLLGLFDQMGVPDMSSCADDQGEWHQHLLAHPSSMAVDVNATIFHTLAYSKDDLHIQGELPANKVTDTQPLVVHVNGHDKKPMMQLLASAGHISDKEKLRLMFFERNRAKKARAYDKHIGTRCAKTYKNEGTSQWDDVV